MKNNLKSSLIALMASVIWGFAFVAQTRNTLGTFTLNALRSLIAFLFLLPVIRIFSGKGPLLKEASPALTKRLWLGGVLAGIALAAASFLQQHGIDNGLPAGKAGFITALYLMLVPLLGLFLGRKTSVTVWIAVFLAVGALYLLCIREGFSVDIRDLFVMGAALMFAVQILLIDRFSPGINGVRMSCIQFLTVFVISVLAAWIFESGFSLPLLMENLFPILFLGIGSSGIAYTLQILAQQGGGDPAVVSVMMSMESVFSVVGGALILGERMQPREYLGCFIMLIAVLFTQLGPILEQKAHNKKS